MGRDTLIVCAGVVVALGACSKKSDDGGTATPDKKQPKPANTATAKSVDAGANSPPQVNGGDAGPAPLKITWRPQGAPPPDKQLGTLIFRRWSGNGDTYQADVFYSSGSGLGAGPNPVYCKGRAVVDVRSGRVLAQFKTSAKLKRKGSDNVEKRVIAACRRLRPTSEWKAFAKTHAFAETKHATTHGGWKLSVEYEKKRGAKWSKVELSPRKDHIAMKWRWLPPWRNKAFNEIMSERGAFENQDKNKPVLEFSPTFVVTATKGKHSWRVLTTQPRLTIGQLSEKVEPGADAEFSFHWSPDGKRVALVVAWTFYGLSEEVGFTGETKVYFKALGPQIKVIGARDKLAPAVAKIEQLGHPVTEVARDPERTGEFEVYWRGKSTEPVANAIAKTLGTDAKKLDTGGWVNVIVIAKK